MSEAISSEQQRVIAEYERRAAESHREWEAARRSDRQVGIARLGAFVIAAWQLWALAAHSEPAIVAGPLALIFSAGFVLLVARHGAIRARVKLLAALERGAADGIARVRREWPAIPPAFELPDIRDHAFAQDLHVGGVQSLVQLFPPLSRAIGRRVLIDWLLAEAPPPVDILRARQQAAGELAACADWRERLAVYASRLAIGPRGLETFLAWAEQGERRPGRILIRSVAYLLGAATTITFFMAVAGALTPAVPTALLVVNVAITAAMRRRLNPVLDVVAGHEWRLRGISDAFRLVANEHFESPLLQQLSVRAGVPGAVAAFIRFDRLAKLSEVRLSPMGHIVLQLFTLWDIHVVDAIEQWRAALGNQMRERLRALGEIEALAALGTLAYDNPSWSFPAFDPRRDVTFDARGLAHPLLAPDVRVANDVTIGSSGDILLITGSNMSGKSTLLRAIGLNVVLAQIGAPVCASAMRLAPVRLRTSIEARDALERGLSLFMSELLRIKSIVDAARASAEIPLLYIADEMLRGTNAADRHAAIMMILKHLVDAHAVGVVATHDPELAADPTLQSRLHPFHFVEHVDPTREPPMWFDYKLRPGLSTTKNAMRLVELVGLG